MKQKKFKITEKKINQLNSMLNEFLTIKAKLDAKIRSYDVIESDLYKEILLEEYLAGMLLMLKALGIRYKLADKQSAIEIEFSNIEEEIDNPEEDLKETFSAIKNKIPDILNKFNEVKLPEGIKKLEKEFHKVIYAFLGATTISNKLGIKFYLENVAKNDLDNYPVLQQIYTQDEEIEDYIEISEKVNEITDTVYKKFNLQKSYEIINWKNVMNTKFKLINEKLVAKKENFDALKESIQINEREKYLNAENEETLNILASLQEQMIITESHHKHLLLEFAKKYSGSQI